MTKQLKELGLSIEQQLDNAVFTTKNSDGSLFYWVDHLHGKAIISAFGAHILSYHPTEQEEQLWLSKTTPLDGSAPIRGGVPICWPWFGGTREPNHGYARTQIWQLKEIQTTENDCQITLILTDAMLEQSEFKFTLECKFTVGKALEIELTTTNLDDHPIEIAAALHTYFATDRDTANVSGMGTTYLDKTHNFAKHEAKEFKLSEETDRLYIHPSSEVCLTHGNGQSVVLNHQGEDTVVIWNPGDKKAATIADIHNLGAQSYLCIEAVRTQLPIQLAPQARYTLAQHISPKA